jgi:hypothetical protein
MLTSSACFAWPPLSPFYFLIYLALFRQENVMSLQEDVFKVAGLIPDEVIGFFNWPNPSSRTMALVSTQPLTEMGTRNLPGSKERPASEADNLTAICEQIV